MGGGAIRKPPTDARWAMTWARIAVIGLGSAITFAAWARFVVHRSVGQSIVHGLISGVTLGGLAAVTRISKRPK